LWCESCWCLWGFWVVGVVAFHGDGVSCGVVHGDDSALVAPLAALKQLCALLVGVALVGDESLFRGGAGPAGWDLVAGEVFVLSAAWVVDGAVGPRRWRASAHRRPIRNQIFRGGGNVSRAVRNKTYYLSLNGRVGSGRVGSL
ncbi:hypothetical protein, partial [Corynebacterium ulcerans]|uniref:hypothetical protein n=1 Tax=Corynebacterium ulcerans TaxID=65058 RepID=UPI0015F19697